MGVSGGYALTLMSVATGTLVLVLPVLLLWRLETRKGRRAAVDTLVLLTSFLVLYLAAGAAVLGALLTVGLMLASAYGYGGAVARWLEFDEGGRGWQGVSLQVAIGLSVVIVLGIITGVEGLLSAAAMAAVVVAGLALAGLEIRRRQAAHPFTPSPLATPAVFWWWGVVLLALIGLVGAVAPEIRHDALTTHLPIAREFALHHAIVDIRQNAGSYFASNGDLLYAIGMVFVPGEAVPKLLHYSAGVLSVLITYDLGVRLWSSRVGILSAGIVAGTPLVWWTSTTAYTDLWTVLFVVGAAAALVAIAPVPTPRRAAVVGLLAGAAAGTKLVSLLMLLPIAAVVAVIAGGTTGQRSRWRAFGAFAFAAGLTGTFWYARAWVLTGNPVFPVLNAVFKSIYWPPENTWFNQGLFGIGRNPWDLLLLPWRVTRYPERFVEEGNIGLAYLLLLPFAALAIVRRKIPHWLWATLAAAGVSGSSGISTCDTCCPSCR